ncbi:hypothetical protein HYH02_015298 [Chlamydomonas schloesseri]|uniref:Protein kinase domain-containing protein n=1 Tax=Chlamydomonas schloesseri TaxID=2026947 RepID=A0A835SAF7_9CHLO|nr:hypothetical protein HYH02_015298 [Chlamydomonas schloesseri]|eukprot:KAG2423683.1 hypothetical protein HYH02_015298 [Chlamydomonas schloesseri]
MPASSVADSETRSINSFASSFSQRSFFGKLNKYELKRRFYEKLDDFKNKVLLHKEQGFVVYRARCVYSGGVVVLKGYSRESLTLQTKQRVFSEVTLLQRAQCPFILKCFDSFEDQGWWWLVLENCAAGDLYRIVQSNGPLREEGWLVSQVLLPILQTLAYLHAEGVIHRDIKPEHVLFNSEKVAKLSGFFLSWDVNRYSYPKDMVGTLDYVAPEVFVLNGPNAKQQQVTHYDYKVDIWGVGVMAYDVLVGQPPFNTDDPNTTVEAILLREAEYPDYLSDDAVDFIDQCLTKDPARRPTARQLLTHPWVRTHLDWEPPEDWEDPIPNIDFSYYRVGGAGGHGEDGLGSEDEGEDDGRRWYNPLTWLRRRNSLEDLLADTGTGRDRDEDGGPGPGGPSAGRGGAAGGVGAVVRGPWQLTKSIGNFAKTLLGNTAQVAPDHPGGGGGGGGRDDVGNTSENNFFGNAGVNGNGHNAGGGGGGGMDGGGGGAKGGKAFQLLPGRGNKPREDLAGVPEGDEDDLDLDPEGGPHHDSPAAAAAIAAAAAAAAANGPGSRKGSFSAGAPATAAAAADVRPYSPPPRAAPPLPTSAAAGGGRDDGSTIMTSARSVENGGGGSRPGSATPSRLGAGAGVGSGKALGAAAADGGGGGAPTKAPAFLPHPTAAPPASQPPPPPLADVETDLPGVAAAVPETATAAAAAVRRTPTPTGGAHDSAASSEMRRSGSSSNSKASGGAGTNSGSGSGSMPGAAAAVDVADLPTERLHMPGKGKGVAAEAEKGTAAAAAAAAAAAEGPERPLPHLSDAVIKSAGEEQPVPVPKLPLAATAATSGSGSIKERAPGSGSGAAAAAAAAAAATDLSMHPVVQPGSSKTTPREREEARRLTGGQADAVAAAAAAVAAIPPPPPAAAPQ